MTRAMTRTVGEAALVAAPGLGGPSPAAARPPAEGTSLVPIVAPAAPTAASMPPTMTPGSAGASLRPPPHDEWVEVPPGRPVGAIVTIAVLVLLLTGLAGLLLTRDGGGGENVASGGPAKTNAVAGDTRPRTTVSPSTASTSTTSPATTESRRGPDADAAGIASAAKGYVDALAAKDLRGAYAMLSPKFQKAQTFESFSSYWGGYDSVSVVGDVVAEAKGRSATVNLSYDGEAPRSFTLELAPKPGGGWLIDGPRPHG
jgi:hypothetical protein